MDLDDLRIFCRVAQLSSFTRAAEQLNMAKGRVSTIVQSLEAEVGRRLLQRTTRSVKLTRDGEEFLVRCKELLFDSERLQGMFRPLSNGLRGSVRIDMPGLFAQELILPKLKDLLSTHPQLDIGISINDRWVDIIQEGVDCVVRIGQLPDSNLVVRTIGAMTMCNLASPAYLRRHAIPLSLEDLENHRIIHYTGTSHKEHAVFRYFQDGTTKAHPMPSAFSVNSGNFMHAACLSGMGIMQLSKPTCQRMIDDGSLIEILPDFIPPPLQVSLLIPHRMHTAPRVKEVLNWLTQTIRPHMSFQN